MSLPFAIFILIGFLALAVVAFGVFSSQKFIGVALFSLVVTVLAVGGAFYAWVESGSVPWTIGYGTIAAVSLVSAGLSVDWKPNGELTSPHDLTGHSPRQPSDGSEFARITDSLVRNRDTGCLAGMWVSGADPLDNPIELSDSLVCKAVLVNGTFRKGGP